MNFFTNSFSKNAVDRESVSPSQRLRAYRLVQEELRFQSRTNNPETRENRSKRRSAQCIEENRRCLGHAYQGLAIVQTALQQVRQIEEKLFQMKELAQRAAGGQYDQEEILSFQSRYSELLCEITEIAVNFRPGGFAMLSFTGFGTVGIEIDQEQKIEVDSCDLTASGLGLLNHADLTRSPAETLTNIDLAAEEIAAYKQHLKESEQLLEKALDTLNTEREAMLPAGESITERYTAHQAVRQIGRALTDNNPLGAALHAHVRSDRVCFLLNPQTTQTETEEKTE
jgi:flagellin-like hook-associated protein FlgL